MFVDTHCHIHESGFYVDDREAVYQRALDEFWDVSAFERSLEQEAEDRRVLGLPELRG